MSFSVTFSTPSAFVQMRCGTFLNKETFSNGVISAQVYGDGSGTPQFLTDTEDTFFYSTLIGTCAVCVNPVEPQEEVP